MSAGATWRGLLVPLLFLIAAEIAVHRLSYQSDTFAAPSAAIASFFDMIGNGSLLGATLETLVSALSGFLIGSSIGLFVGIWMGLSKVADNAFSLTVDMLRPVPAIALLPILMLIFGLGFQMEIAMVAFTCIWPMLILSRAAISEIDVQLKEVSRLLEFSSATFVRKIVIPAILPRVFVACRLTFGIALIVSVTCEIVANPIGLGHAIMLAQQTLRPEAMFAMLGWIALLGWAVNYGLLKLERTLFKAWG